MMKKSLMMTITLLLAIVQGAWAESVTFNVRSWDDTNKQVVTTATTKEATVLEGSHPDDWLGLGGSDDQDYYYVVRGNVSYQTLNCFGNVHLILADGATLTCTGGIKVDRNNNNSKLFIYSQSDGDSQGRLVVTNSYSGAAGIGSAEGLQCGGIEIHGGNLDITGGKEAAGIGAGLCTSTVGTGVDHLVIYGGKVKAQGGKYGAGIGGGGSYYFDNVSHGAKFRLYGGDVTATGGTNAAGVGGGSNYVFGEEKMAGGSGDCRIYGGKLTAQGGHRGAGIGGGSSNYQNEYKTNYGSIYIEGGIVNATGGKYGAGIGGGCNFSGGTITIAGGTVTAIGGVDGAGIGGGEDGSGGYVTISGGTVRAEGRSYGAGIGGGDFEHGNSCSPAKEQALGAKVIITGGTVVAIVGEDCNARKADCGSAIGVGEGIYNKDDDFRARPLRFPNDYRVTAGDAEDNIERVFTSSERVAACRWRNYVKIEPCTHKAPTVGSDHTNAVTFTIDNNTHTMHCRYCTYTLKEAHVFVDNVCACGKREDTNDDLCSVTLHRASAAGSYSYADRVVMMVVKGQAFTIPAVNATEGLTLMGYATSWIEPDGIEMKDGETLTAVGTVVTPGADISYYPRYRYRYEPTWTWDDDDATATLSIVCSALSSEAINVTDITYTTDGDVKTATGTYVHNGATYTFTGTYLLPLEEPIALHDASSNDETLDNYRDRKVKTLMINGRTLHEDDSWNTLCLPFDLSEDEAYRQLYHPSALKTLYSSSYDSKTGTLTLNFADAYSIEAGKPYLIKWTSGPGLKNPIFSNVIISVVSKPATTDYVDFIGSFSPFTLEANDRSVLYLGADNKLYHPSADMTIGSFRAVFKLKGVNAGDLAQQARAFVLNFGDGEQMGITTTNFADDTNSVHAWFDLSGRKLDGKPTAKGIYIHNGKKYISK